jgi:osmotically-inducible protein OsmY
VRNQIDVNDWLPRTETARLDGISRKADRLAQSSQSDHWLSAAVGYTLSFSQSVGSCAIDVTATDSVVALRGRTASTSARAAAIAAAEGTIGVRSVEAGALVVE